MKNVIKFAVFTAVLAAIGLTAVGYGSLGGSHEVNYHNSLVNGRTAMCDSNGTPIGPVNGSESYEHHSSWELNPLVWGVGFLKAITPRVNYSTEVVVNNGPGAGYYNDGYEQVYYNGSAVYWLQGSSWAPAPPVVIGRFHNYYANGGGYRGNVDYRGGGNYSARPSRPYPPVGTVGNNGPGFRGYGPNGLGANYPQQSGGFRPPGNGGQRGGGPSGPRGGQGQGSNGHGH